MVWVPEAEFDPASAVWAAAFEAVPAFEVWAGPDIEVDPDTAAGLGIEADPDTAADPDIAAGPDTAAEAAREEPAVDIEAVDLAERPVPEAVTVRE